MFETESHLAAAFQQSGVSEAVRPRGECVGGPAPPELVHIAKEWRIGPERGQGFEQQRPVALLSEHRRGKGLDRAVLVQEPRGLDALPGLVVGPEVVAERLDDVIGCHTDVSRSGLDHLQYRMQHAADSAEALILALAEMAPAVKLAEQLVRAVEGMNYHAAASGRRSRSALRQPARSPLR